MIRYISLDTAQARSYIIQYSTTALMSVRDGEHLTRPPVIILPLMPLLVYIAPSFHLDNFFLLLSRPEHCLERDKHDISDGVA